MKIKHIIYLLFFFAFLSCEPEIESFKPSAGDADFSSMIAVGNSLTAGFADGELYRSAQLTSFPNIVAQQLQHVGGGEFNQPLMKDDYGFGNRLVLKVVDGELRPVPAEVPENPENFVSIYDEEGPFHNLGVPGAKTSHLLAPGYGVLNQYFGRFAKDVVSSSVLSDAMIVDPTFFILWIGNNDILSYAMSGGEGETITDIDSYSSLMNIILNELTSNGAKGAIANIPEVTAVPFFNTIPSTGLVLTAEEAAALNIAYEDVPHIEFQEGPNGFVVKDVNIIGGIRQLKPEELLLLSVPRESILNEGLGSEIPIAQEDYLSEEQINNINNAVNLYNNFIENAADNFDLALVDVYTLLKEAETGMYFDGINFTTQFITGGVFSLDGIHLTARGNAIVANQVIDAINQKYNSSIPKVSVTDYQGIIFP